MKICCFLSVPFKKKGIFTQKKKLLLIIYLENAKKNVKPAQISLIIASPVPSLLSDPKNYPVFAYMDTMTITEDKKNV